LTLRRRSGTIPATMARTAKQLSVELALLGYLIEQPLHGYDIFGRLQEPEQLGTVWRLKQAHLYALLSRLEDDGLLEGENIAQEARPPKRLLHLTPAGRVAFDNWLQRPVRHGRDLRIEFLAKLFWARRLDENAARRLIAAQRAACEAWLATEHGRHAQNESYARLVSSFRRGQIEAMLRWLDECEKER